MRLTLQRVRHASVSVDGVITGSIGNGLLAFVGFGREDDGSVIEPAIRKMLELRIFCDEAGKLNRSLLDNGGSVLAISQFTLYANCSRGRRPDFTQAAPPKLAGWLYETFVNRLREIGIVTQTGVFAADMQVELLNDGPVTINLQIDPIKKSGTEPAGI